MSPTIVQACAVLRAGGIVAYPTEAVYGLGCDPMNPGAIARLTAMKQRPAQKSFILLASDFSQLQAYCGEIDEAAWRRVQSSWPGAHTWIFPASANHPEWLRGDKPGVAVRVTAHPVAAELCRACGSVVVSTSANLSARPPARTAEEVRALFGDAIDCIVEGETGGAERPTPIRDAVTNRLIRT